MLKTILENEQVILSKKEVYNHRTTPLISWVVFHKGSNLIVSETSTKKEALEWVSVYSKPRVYPD